MTTNTNSAIAPVQFNFNSLTVRIITDETGEPWFLANDVCAVLGYANPRQTVERHCRKGGVSKRDTPTESGAQEMTYINEGNLYRLIIKSRKPEAEPFETWVCDDVLPTIRKTGKYEQSQYGLKQLQSPRAKKLIPGGLWLYQQDSINDFIKERMLTVPQERRAAMAIRIYSAINTKFGTKGMKDGYKNIATEHFDNIMLMIARLPLDEKELLTFAPLELSALIRENIERAKVGVLVGAEPVPRPAYSPRIKLLVTIENGETSESLVPFGCCVVDPKNSVNIKTFIDEYVAWDMLPTITNAVFAKLNRQLDRAVKNTAALG